MTTRLAAALLLAGLGLGTVACEKDTPPPPLPDAEPVKKDAAPLELEPEPDAGTEDAAAPAPKKGGTGKKGPSLAACCKALEQNVASQPPSMQGYYAQAAAACHLALQTGATGVVPSIKAALKNAQMPPGCL